MEVAAGGVAPLGTLMLLAAGFIFREVSWPLREARLHHGRDPFMRSAVPNGPEVFALDEELKYIAR